MKKIVDIEITHDWLGTNTDSDVPLEKKAAAAQRKIMRELQEKYPIRIEVAFQIPWWVASGTSAE